jgi:regulator of Ty1 transposition protein 103
MHAAGLAALVKKLAVAEGAVAESIKARSVLITGLEKLLQTNKTKLSAEEAQLGDLGARKAAIESRKREVEEAILKGLSAAETHQISAAPLAVPSGSKAEGYERPTMEELTPPPMESFTPVGSPRADVPDDVFPTPVANPVQPVTAPAPMGVPISSTPATAIAAPPGADLLSSLRAHAVMSEGTNGGGYNTGTYKKRKMSRNADEDEFAAFAGDGDIDGIDADVGDLI